MSEQFKPSWCGLPLQDPRVPRAAAHHLGDWSLPAGPVAYCSEECRAVRRRQGWHTRREDEIPAFQGLLKQVTEELGRRVRADVFGPVHDLTEEHIKAKKEIERLKAKVNRLLTALDLTCAQHEQTYDALNTMTGKRNEAVRQNTQLREENENLRKAHDALGEKNSALLSDVAELHGELVSLEQRRDEEKAFAYQKYNLLETELRERILQDYRARAILENFVFEVLEQCDRTTTYNPLSF